MFTADLPLYLASLRGGLPHILLLLGPLIWWEAFLAEGGDGQKRRCQRLTRSHLPRGPFSRHDRVYSSLAEQPQSRLLDGSPFQTLRLS